MTVGAAPRQPGFFDGTAASCVDPAGERPAWPVLRRECHRLFPEEMSAARRRHRHRYHPLPPADIKPNTGREPPRRPPALRPRTLATTNTCRRDLNAHPRRTTDRGDCPRAQRTSESLLSRGARNRACAVTESRTPRPTGLLSRSPQITPSGVMPGWCAQRPGAATWPVRIVRAGGDPTMDARCRRQAQVGRTNGKEFPMGFRRRTRRRAIIAGAAIAHHEDKKAGEQQQADDQAPPTRPGACRRRPGPGAICAPSGGPGRRDRTPRTVAHLGRALRRRVHGGQGENTRVLNACRIARRC